MINIGQVREEARVLVNTLRADTSSADLAVEENRSPENYYCDGEISKTEANKRHAILKRKAKELRKLYLKQIDWVIYVERRYTQINGHS